MKHIEHNYILLCTLTLSHPHISTPSHSTAQDQDVPSTQPPFPHPSATNKLASVSGASIKSSHSSNNSQMASTVLVLEEKQPASVFLQTAAYLLDVHALKVSSILRVSQIKLAIGKLNLTTW